MTATVPAPRPTHPGGHRDPTLDNARAIGIVAVVAGHTMGIPPALGELIYAVHMPLFFLLAGWVLKDAVLALPAAAWLRRQARSLLLPYAVFFALGFAYWLATSRIGSRAAKFADTAWHEPLAGLVTGRFAELQTANGPLWFFPALALALTLAWLAWAPSRRRWAVPAVVAAAVAIVTLRPGDLPVAPWSADVAVVAAAFVLAGLVVGRTVDWARVKAATAATLAVAAGAACLALAHGGGAVDFAQGRFGDHPLRFAAAAASGIVAVLAVSRLLPASAVANWLARHTVVIFPTHVLVLNLLSGIAQIGFGLDAAAVRTPAFALASTVLALAAAVPTAWLLARLWPTLVPPSAGRPVSDAARPHPPADRPASAR